MRKSRPCLMFQLILGAIATIPFVTSGQAGEPFTELELLTEPGFPSTDTREWLSALDRAGFDRVRIRRGRTGERALVENTGTEASPRYRVVGVLTSGRQLRLPNGGRFTVREIGRIREWKEKLGQSSEGDSPDESNAFGLTASQLLSLHKELSATVNFTTKEVPAVHVLKQIADLTEADIQLDTDARGALQTSYKFPDELQGMSCGTALAATLRTLGLVAIPRRKSSDSAMLLVTKAKPEAKFWPVGWPKKESPGKTLPALFKFLPVAVNETPLADTLAAISGRIEAPIIYDHYALAVQDIDPQTLLVSFPQKRTYYMSIIDSLLIPNRMRSEIRLDENNKPFLWVMSGKR